MAEPYGQVRVEDPPSHNGVRVNHPSLLTAVRNALKQGWANEHIVRVVGVHPSVIERERSKLKQAKST